MMKKLKLNNNKDELIKDFFNKSIDQKQGIHCLIGPNGIGKSYSLRLIYNWIIDKSNKEDSIFFIDGNLPEWIQEMKISKISNMEEFNFLPKKEIKINEMSQGQQKLFMLRMALLANSKYNLLDEPFVNLDQDNVSILEKEILNLSKNKQIFLATNNSRIINNLCFNKIELGDKNE